MNTTDLQNASYYVSGLHGFTLSEAMRLWKAKFETASHFQRDVITHPGLEKLGGFVSDMWESIQPVTVQEALSEKNIERRRVMFDCIGVVRMFAELDPELIDKQTITKNRARWNEGNQLYMVTYDDTYELYRIDATKLFGEQPANQRPAPVYAVRCWCTTTAREYWIYVPEHAAIGVQAWQRENAIPDAIRAIAWTIQIDISNPSRIYRQGDIIVVEESADSKQVAPYHISKEQYLELMFAET